LSNSLAQLVQHFIQRGYDPLVAAEMAAAIQSAQGGRNPSPPTPPLARQAPVVNFPPSPQGGNVDYGDETPEQAKQRWYEQERQDPQGLFTGGASGGGVFGHGPIATSDYDPDAYNRTEERMARAIGVQTQQETLRVLGRMSARMDQLPPSEEEPRRRLPKFTSRLSRKIRGR